MCRDALFLCIVALVAGFAANCAYAKFDPSTGIITSERWKSGVPLGGIGCGNVELYTDGAFGSATINNNWDRPTGFLRGAFAALWIGDGEKTVARMLRGGDRDEYQGVPNIASTEYLGLYPRAELTYKDPAVPLGVRLEAFCPIIPQNTADSSLPVALMAFTLTNPLPREVQASVLFSWPNILGWGGDRSNWWESYQGNFQEPYHANGQMGLLFGTTQSYSGPRQNTVGQYLLVTPDDGADVTTCDSWYSSGRDVPFWGDFARNGTLRPVGERADMPFDERAGAVAAKVMIPANSERTVRFVLVWHLPSLIMEREELVVSDQVDESSNGVELTVDGKEATRWGTGRQQVPGDYFTIGLPQEQEVTGVTLDSRPSPNDWPRAYRLEVSVDGMTWNTVTEADATKAAQQQNKGLLDIRFPAVRCRFLRITETGSDTFYWWSIHELHVTGSDGPIKLDPALLKAGVHLTERQRVSRDVGHFYTASFPDAEAVAQYAMKNWDRLHEGVLAWQNLILESNLPWWLKLKLINCAFTMTDCTVLTRDGAFSVLESPVDMGGALGTMDQRMAAHGFYTQMFTDLDRTEIELFAKCQQTDGRITHFVGNVHEAIGDPTVGYGVTDWPDLSCAWVMQVLKLYRWTGDRAFLLRMWPHVQSAMAWLKSADQDGDLIPEGGSTYDYEQLPSGAFIYNASCYLGALRAAGDIARIVAEPPDGTVDASVKAQAEALASAYAERFSAAQKSVLHQLWAGSHFIKWKDPKSGKKIPDTFVASLAGDWLSRLSGSGRTLPPNVTRMADESLIARHLRPFRPVPPMEVTPEIECTTSTCYLLQEEPYLGCESIYEGYVDDGLDLIKRVYQVVWEKNRSPWSESLCYSAPDGAQGGLQRYMTCPTTWHVLNALSGTTLDLAAQTLWLNPRVPTEMGELHIPLFFPTFWAQLDFQSASKTLKLTVTRIIGDSHGIISQVITSIDKPAISLAQPFAITQGAVLDLSSRYDELNLEPASRQVPLKFVPKRRPRAGIPTDGWSATSVLTGNDPGAGTEANAFDDAPGTRWATNRPMQPGDWYTLDLGKLQRICGVTIDTKESPHDWPRGLVIDVSTDGRQWTLALNADERAVWHCGRHGLYTFRFPATAARYVKLIQQGSTPYWWWSIHEVYVMPADGG